MFDGYVSAEGARLVTSSTGTTYLHGLGLLGNGEHSAGSIEGAGRYSIGGRLTVGSNGLSTEVSGAIVEGGSLVKTGAGTLTLSGANTYTGTTTVNAGLLRAGAANVIASSSELVLSNAFGATFDLNNHNQAIGTLSGGGSNGGNIALGSAHLRVNQTASSNYDGVISGSGSLTKDGAGTLTLSGASSYSGTTTINAGTLQAGTSNAIASSSALVLADVASTRFSLGGFDQSIGTLSGGGSGGGHITLGSSTLTVNQTANSSYGGTIAGSGGVTKTGAGTLTLTGTNFFAGSIDISGGALRIENFSGLGNDAGGTTVAAGAALELAGGITVSGEALTLSGAGVSNGGALRNVSGANSYSGAITLASDTRIAGDADLLSLHGVVSGTDVSLTVGGAGNTLISGGVSIGGGSLTKDGSGVLFLFPGNSYTGATIVNDGTIQVRGANVFASSSGLVLANASGAALELGGYDQTISALSGGGSIRLTNATLTVNQTTSTSYGGWISRGGGLTKTGTGTLTLTAANSYTGTTAVNGGTLLVNGSLASSVVSVGNGGTLGGSGTITGAVTVASGGTLSAGNSPGTLTVQSLVLQGGSNTVFELNTPGVAGSGTNDRIIVNGTGAAGNLELGGTLAATVASAGYYRLFDVTGGGTISGSFDTVTLSAPTVAGAAGTVYKSPAGASSQVNLAVVGSGQNLQFWDGGDQSGNGTVDGGAGTWNAANTNWTKAPGEAGINAPWLGSVGVFQGAAGTVTVSGTQDFDTLQFNSDGYLLNGGSLRLGLAGGSTFNVSAGVTATIASGFVDGVGASLNKVGSGTLVLTGNNSHSGGTTISAGTLSVSADANLGAAGGALTLDGGVLQVTGTGLTQLSRNIVFGANGGGFDIADAGNAFTVTQSLSGTGALSKAGAGTLVLSGANTYTDATTVAGGTLRAGAAGSFSAASAFTVASGAVLDLAGSSQSVGSLAGSGTVALGAGTLTAGNNNASATFSGVISGAGGLTKAGVGTFTLSGANSYTGATTVAGGTLQAGAAGSFAPSSAFTVASGAVLDLAGLSQNLGSLAGVGSVALGAGTLTTGADGSSTTFSGAIAGSGDLIKTGAGTFTLTGTSSHSGATTVNAGKLVVNGSLASSVTVNGGATLGGSGTVGGIAVASGGTVAPGNSIGTLSVTGNVAFAPGSTYQVEVNAAGQGDRINAAGLATLSGGTVQALAEAGNYAAATSYTILTATGGVTGQFAGITSNLAFLTPSLSYDSQNVRLTMTRNDTSFGPTPAPDGSGGESSRPDATAPNYIAGTRNQGGIASAAEWLGPGNPIYDALISATAEEARAGFALLSGETHAQGIAVAVAQSGGMRDTLLGHLRGPLLSPSGPTVTAGFSAERPGRQDAVLLPAPVRQPRFRLWGEAYGAQGRSAADGNAASLHSRTGGFLLGADALVAEGAGSSFSLGVAGGYSRSDVDSDGRLSSGRLEAGQAALYAATRLGAWRLDGGLGYSFGETSLTRQVRIRGFGDTLRSQRDSRVMQAFAELGYGISFQTFALEPFAQLALLRISTGSGVEQGGAAALRLLSSEHSLGFATLGLRAEAQLGAMPLFARGLLGWRYGFGDLTPQTLTTFAIGTTPAQVYGAPIDRSALIAEAGLDWRLGGGTTLGVAYSAALGKQAQDHALKGRFELRF